MSPQGRPKGESPRPQAEGTPVNPQGRLSRGSGAVAAGWFTSLLLAGCVPFSLNPPPPPAPAPAPPPAVAAAASAAPVPAPPPPEPAASAASAPAGPAAAGQAATPADLAAREMLAFHERVRQLPPPELARELARLNEAPPGPPTTLQLALVLGQTRNNGDVGRALSLLEPLLQSSAPEAVPWQPLARLLATRYGEQRRMEEQIERQAQQARENQRKLQQLNEKLEALKAIERNLTTQPAAAPGPGPGSSAAPPASAPAPAPGATAPAPRATPP
jgi:hypothetical protein